MADRLHQGLLGILADRIEEGLLLLDAQWRIASANAAFARALGYGKDELPGRPLSDLLTPAAPLPGSACSAGAITSLFDAALSRPQTVQLMTRGGAPLSARLTAVNTDDTEFPQVRGAAFFTWPCDGPDPRVDYELPVASSIFLEKVFSSTYDGIFVVDPDGIYILVNKAFSELTGYSREEIIGVHTTTVLPDVPGDVPIGEIIQPVETVDGCSRYETLWKRKDGTIFPVEICFTALEDTSEGGFVAMIGIVRDITARKRMDQELRLSRAVLERTVTERTKNLEDTNTALRVLLNKRDEDRKILEDNMLHNINKLVMPYLEKLRAGRADDRQKIYLEIIEKNLNEILAPLMKTDKYLSFTPTELQITNLIKQGKSTKEIAEVMSVCEKTVTFHRDSIRRKMGLTGSKISLRNHLAMGK